MMLSSLTLDSQIQTLQPAV